MAYGMDPKATSAGISNTEYAKQTNKLITLIKELRGLGAQADIDLPRIAVIGNQSAGKSSLVEAISGITVPRAKGTCTRCPMECRLQKSADPWRCQVFLRIETDEAGHRVSDVREEKFGPPLTNKSELEDMLRRAQLAILNPSVPYKSFVNLDLNSVGPDQPPIGDKRPLQFSSNVVALDLSGEELTDLSFIDLPGIISNVGEGEDRKNIPLVQDLVKEHIKGNSIILLTLTMKDDIENQSAALFAKEADPEGLRTIGVLTKADVIESGDESMWMNIIQGKRHKLKNGYYVTKQPGPEELARKPSFEEARRQEQDFFAITEPWKSSEVQVKSRTGVPKLTTELSKLLSHLILQTLPKLRTDAQKSLDATLEELSLLPPPLPDNLVSMLLNLVTTFTTETKKFIDAAEGKEDLVRVYMGAAKEFKKNILLTAPNLRPYTNAEEEITLGAAFSPPADAVAYGVFSDVYMTLPSSPMFLLDVRDYVERARGRELPFNVPYSAKRSLIVQSFTTWNDHAMTFFDIVCHATKKRLNALVNDHFRRFATSPLKDAVSVVVENVIDNCRKDTQQRITEFLELENEPYTQNLPYFASLREKYLLQYKIARNYQKINLNEFAVARALQVLAESGFRGLTPDSLYRLPETDEYEEELIVMAEVSAYCRVAHKRVIDDLPRIIDRNFLHAFGEHIQQALIEELGIGSKNATERANVYVEEDPRDVVKRNDLLAKERRLKEVLRKLREFQFNH